MVARPKPKRESRTIRFNNLTSLLVAALAALPSLISYVFELLGDPVVSAAVSDAIPGKYRAMLAIVVLIITQRNKALRMNTSAPIAERRSSMADESPVAEPPDVPAPHQSRPRTKKR